MDSTAFQAPLRDAVERVAACCRQVGLPAWWVGGTVRDSMLGAAPQRPELDLAHEQDPTALVACLQQEGAVLRRRSRFGTLSLSLAQGVSLDVAATRGESYPRPGALPQVRPAPLSEDLARRDFSINAMALPVGGGEFLDPMNGLADLRGARLRVLHHRSFEDDPTRILRGVRFEARWSFRFEGETELAAREVVTSGGLWSVGPDRLRCELERCAGEQRLLPIVARWEHLGIWRALDAAMPPPERLARWDASPRRTAPSSLGTWVLLLSGCSPTEGRAAAQRLRLPRPHVESIQQALRWISRWEGVQPGEAASLSPALESWSELDGAVRAVLVASSPHTGDWLSRLEAAAGLVLTISGGDLIAVGVPPGPAVGAALRSTLAARRRGEIGVAQELEFARRMAEQSIHA